MILALIQHYRLVIANLIRFSYCLIVGLQIFSPFSVRYNMRFLARGSAETELNSSPACLGGGRFFLKQPM
jgi:hypothetical protein